MDIVETLLREEKLTGTDIEILPEAQNDETASAKDANVQEKEPRQRERTKLRIGSPDDQLIKRNADNGQKLQERHACNRRKVTGLRPRQKVARQAAAKRKQENDKRRPVDELARSTVRPVHNQREDVKSGCKYKKLRRKMMDTAYQPP